MNIAEKLALFTADERDSRTYLQKPFALDGHSCASCGYTFVAISDSEQCSEYDSVDSKISEYMIGLISRAADAREFSLFANLVNMPLTDESTIVCEECLGKDYVEFYNGHTHYECKCGSCDGRGSFTSHHTLPIGLYLYRTCFLRKAMAVADRFCIVDDGTLCFYGDGLVGGIMPTTYKGINLTGKGQIPL